MSGLSKSGDFPTARIWSRSRSRRTPNEALQARKEFEAHLRELGLDPEGGAGYQDPHRPGVLRQDPQAGRGVTLARLAKAPRAWKDVRNGHDRSAMGVAHVRRPFRDCRDPVRGVDAGRRAGERRAVLSRRVRRERESARRSHGHQGPPGGERRRPGALGAGHEAGLPVAGCRRGEGVRVAGSGRAPARPGRLHPRPVHRRARRAEWGVASRQGPQAPGPLHRRRLHRGAHRRPGGGQGHPHHRDRSRGRGRRRLGRRIGRPRRLLQHELCARPAGAARRCAGALRGDRRGHEFGQAACRRA